jgi:hypothetical protein
MYKNAEKYQECKRSGNMSAYKPVATEGGVDINLTKSTVTVNGLKTAGSFMKKYFGTDDAYAIYVPAAEQEYGAGKKKPSTAKNKSVNDNTKS